MKIALNTEVFSSNLVLNVSSFNVNVPSWFVATPNSAKYLSDVSKPIIGPVKILFILFLIVLTMILFCKGAFSSLRSPVVSSLIFSLVTLMVSTNSFNVVNDELLSRDELILNELDVDVLLVLH